MTFWIILGAVGTLLWIAALIVFIAMCVRAKELPTPEADERASSATLYPTTGRKVHATVVSLMHAGVPADTAAARAYGHELRQRGRC